MTAAVYYTLLTVSVVFTCNAQLLPGSVPLFVGQPINSHYQNMNGNTIGLPLSQKFITREIPMMPSLAARMPRLRLGTSPSSRTFSANPIGTPISPLQLKSTDANGQKDVPTAYSEDSKVIEKFTSPPVADKNIGTVIEKIKKEESKNAEGKLKKRKSADSMDPFDQETDEIPKQVLGLSGSFSNHSTSSAQPKARSPGTGESIPDLDYLSRAANPIVDWEKKAVNVAKKVGTEIKHTFQNIPKLFQGRTGEGPNEEGSAPYNNYQSGSNKPNLASGLKMAMDDFQKSISKSPLMQKYYDNQKPGSNYGNQYNTDVYSHGKQASPAENFWDSATDAAKNFADSSMNGGQPRTEQTEGRPTTGLMQENNPTSFWNSASKAASNFADTVKNSDYSDSRVPTPQQNGIPADFWQSVSEYVANYAKNTANAEQLANNQFLGGPNRYGYGYGGYPGYYGDGHHGHHEHHEHPEHHDNHGHYGYGSYNPYYSGYYQHGYYPRPVGWQYGNGYYKRSPIEVVNSTVSRNARGLPMYLDGGDVAESVFDLVRSIMDGRPDEIAHAGINVGSQIADVTSDSDVYKRSNLKEAENATSARSSRQMPSSQGTMQHAQPGGITNSALLLAQSILAGRPDQIANAGVNMGSGIAGTVNLGPRFFKRSHSVEAEDASLLRSPRQMLPMMQLPGLTSPVQTGIASTALNFAQGFLGANPNQGIIQPIVGGMGMLAGGLARGLMNNQGIPTQGLPVNQLGQIAGSAVNLVHGIMNNSPGQTASAGVNMGLMNNQDVPTQGLPVNQLGQIASSAFNLAQGIMSNRPEQIANAGMRMGSDIAGTATAQAPRFFKRSESTKVQNTTSTRILRQMPYWLQGRSQPAGGITNSALNLAQGIVSGNPSQIAQSGMSMGTGIAGTGIAAPRLFKSSDSTVTPSDTSPEASKKMPFWPQGWSQSAGGITTSALKLAQGILSGNPDQIANSGVNMGTGIAGTGVAVPRFFKRSDLTEAQNATSTRISRQMPSWLQGLSQPAGGITTSALNLAQGIVSGNPGQIAKSGMSMGTSLAETGIADPRFFKSSDSAAGQSNTSPEASRKMPFWPQGWSQPAGEITTSALKLAQGILSGNPDQIANSGVNMGTGIAGTANGAGFNAPRFFKRSPQGGIWQSATGLAGSIANSATVDPAKLDTQEIVATAGTIWKAASKLFGNIGKVIITPVNSDQIVGATKDGGSALPADLIWESASDLAGNIAKVTEEPSILGKVITSSNSPDKKIIKSPHQVANGGHSMILGATKPSGEIANSATLLASRIASLLMNPNVLSNPNLDATDLKSSNPVLNPIYMARDIVGAAINPGAYRNVRMLKSYAPTHAGGYGQSSVPAIPISSQQPSTILVY